MAKTELYDPEFLKRFSHYTGISFDLDRPLRAGEVRDALTFILSLDEDQQFRFISHIFLNIARINLLDARRITWMYRAQKNAIYEKALIYSIKLVKCGKAKRTLEYFYYKHSVRNLSWDNIYKYTQKDQVASSFFLKNGYLFRAYIISRARAFSLEVDGSIEPEIDPKDCIPSLPGDGVLSQIRSASYYSQIDAVNQTHNLSMDPFQLCEKEISKLLEGSSSPFVDSLKKIKSAKNVAVVLKGPSLKRKRAGYLIDSHDLVVRGNIFDSSNKEVYGKSEGIVYYAAFLENYVKTNFPENKYLVQMYSGSCDESNIIGRRIKSLISHLSYEQHTTGFGIILLCLVLCRGIVSVFGFDSYSPLPGEIAYATEEEKEEYRKVRELAAPAHEIDYEHWYVHQFLKNSIFFDKLVIV